MTNKHSFVLGIDQGTTNTRAFRLAADGALSAACAFEHRQFYPQAGWVEHDPLELLHGIEACLSHAGGAVAAGLANQGETVLAWNAETGEPLYNALVWQDTRTAQAVERLRADGLESVAVERAGVPLDALFPATKLRWLLDHAPGARALARAGRLRLGTSDSFFLDRLCGVYATDVTTASRTGLMNIVTGQWDPELCRAFGVPLDLLPEIRATAGPFGTIRNREIPLSASMAGQQAALFGHGCREPGQVKISFDSGAFVAAVAGAEPPVPAWPGVLPAIAWKLGDATTYETDGGVFNAGSALNWVRSLGLYTNQTELDRFDGPSALERGVVFVPALSGLACPYWERSAAGLWLGLGLDTDRRDLVRSALEGVALRSAEVVRVIGAGQPLADTLSIDGALARSRYFCEFLARASRRTVVVPSGADLTGLGCAQLAYIGAGLGARPDALPPVGPPERVVDPVEPLDDSLLRRFEDAVSRTRGWRHTPDTKAA
ncbi:MAG: glycerol kinase [Betaproteobacteria bacterium]|nr:glycerol kinase [Betaproteobacteria bacterium]